MQCPCCDGSGNSPLLRIKCLWCRGEGKVSPKTAVRYTHQKLGLIEGGYLAGEYTPDELFAARREAREYLAAMNDPAG